MSKKFAWTPSAVLPKQRVSFADVSYEEMVSRAHALAPKLAARAEACEKLRRLPDDTERDLHDAGLFRFVQPKRVGGAELDVGIFIDVCAALARVCPSTAWNVGNLGSHHWMLGYFPPETQDELWDTSLDVLIATSLAFAGGRGRKVDGGWEVTGRWPLSSGVDNSDWNMLGFMVRDEAAPSSTSVSRSPIARSTRSSTPGMPWACAARDRRTSRSRNCSCPSGARSRPGPSTASRIRGRR